MIDEECHQNAENSVWPQVTEKGEWKTVKVGSFLFLFKKEIPLFMFLKLKYLNFFIDQFEQGPQQVVLERIHTALHGI